MKCKLTSAAIAAAIFASSSLVMVRAASAADKPPADTTSAETQKADQTQKKAKQTTKKASEKGKPVTSDKATKAKAKAKAKKAKTEEPVKEKVESATEQAHEAAEKANIQIVGKKTQTENERRAQERREREAREDEEAKRAGEKVGRATTTAATAVVGAAQDVTRAMDVPGPYTPIVATWNPLGLIVGGRVSFNVEYAPVTHHVLIMSPHFASPSQDVSVSPGLKHTNRFTGGGLELGYRYYTGHRGPNGVFIGPSLIGGVYNAGLIGGDTLFTNIGVAADVGFQELVWDHLALGAGVGVEYLHVSRDFGDLSSGPSTIASSGVKPRLLAQAGYAF